ncbi:MAG TPA: hypothetical protein DDY13_05325 [Cytophagales bacterium]|jgi:hypothetical protein|nr:hypothetical protein [Cytophagales bacterium]
MRKSNGYRTYHWNEGAKYLASFLYGDFVRNKDGHIRRLFNRWNYEVEGVSHYNGDEVFRVSASLPLDNNHEQYKALFYVRIKDYAFIQLDYDF